MRNRRRRPSGDQIALFGRHAIRNFRVFLDAIPNRPPENDSGAVSGARGWFFRGSNRPIAYSGDSPELERTVGHAARGKSIAMAVRDVWPLSPVLLGDREGVAAGPGAVHGQRHAADHRRVVGGQEQRRVRDIFWLAGAAQRMQRGAQLAGALGRARWCVGPWTIMLRY